jgi:hypothetical protein
MPAAFGEARVRRSGNPASAGAQRRRWLRIEAATVSRARSSTRCSADRPASPSPPSPAHRAMRRDPPEDIQSLRCAAERRSPISIRTQRYSTAGARPSTRSVPGQARGYRARIDAPRRAHPDLRPPDRLRRVRGYVTGSSRSHRRSLDREHGGVRRRREIREVIPRLCHDCAR